MKRREFLQSTLLTATVLTQPVMAQKIQKPIEKAWVSNLEHLSDDADSSRVLYTSSISSAALLNLYRALNHPVSGKVGMKITFETPDGPHLDPQLLAPICKELEATLVDCNGFTPPRDQTKTHLQVAEHNGFSSVAPIDILDSEGDMILPVKGGHLLTQARTGKHFAEYDSLISVVRFKAHHLPRYGGTLKNLSICLGSIAGKAIIHSGGKTSTHYTSSDPLTTARAMADAAKAAIDAKRDRWLFFQVINSFDPTDGCTGATNLGDIGIFASTDPVALDQVAIDITFGAGPDNDIRRQWQEYHSTFLPELAEKIGVGTRKYHLESID